MPTDCINIWKKNSLTRKGYNMFEHFLITRFNLQAFHHFVADKQTWLEWNKRRFPIFREYCLPSILNQSNKNFKWLIYFDTETPNDYDEHLNYLKQHDFIEVCYAKGDSDFRENLAANIKGKLSPTTKWVITSRIDNDDCLHRDAIDRIQKEFVAQDKFMIYLARGYVYDTTIQKLSWYYYLKSPFASIVEEPNSIQAVFHKHHNRWPGLQTSIVKELYYRSFKKNEKPRATFVLDDTLWMQVCHGKNLGNDFYRGFPVLRSCNLNDFGLEKTSKPSRYIDIFKYIVPKIWWRQLLAAIFRIVRRKKK